jgi:hypothetical protein
VRSSALLARHLPLLRFDSRERYFPVSANAWTDCPGHVLRRADGAVLADRASADTPRLELSFLGAERYRDGAAVRAGDNIASPGRGYRAKAEAFQADPRYALRVYGRAQAGSDGRTWLQYRWFYFLNDYRLVGRWLAVGMHEGDWEMIQLRLDAQQRAPDLALYTHHRAAQTRVWEAVETVGEQPVVYVARGSHGCYFTAGTRWTGAWFDHVDGRLDRGPLQLELVGDGPAHEWIRWPGAWGGTVPRRGPVGALDGQSPAGPGAPSHIRWRDPAILFDRVTG